MPAVSRRGDICTGHASFPPRPSIDGSENVIVGGIGALRVGDGFAVHCNPSPSCHASELGSGSSTVIVNGRGIGRVGDPVACGSAVAKGEPTVLCNDKTPSVVIIPAE